MDGHDGSDTSEAISARSRAVILSALTLGMLMGALDLTILGTALPTIAADLHHLDQISWVFTAFVLSQTGTTPIFGKLGDLYGRKRLYLATIALFVVASAACGMATSMMELIALRAVQGVGAGGLMVLAQAIIGDVVAPRQRARYQSYMGAVNAIAILAGPTIGGLLVDHLSWRWAFFINLPIGAVALVATATVLPSDPGGRHHTIDYQGSALLMAGVTAVLLAATWGGRDYEWGSPLIIGLAVGGVALLALFARCERRAAEPILPLDLFRNSVVRVTCAVTFLVSILMLGLTIYIPMFLQIVRGASPTNSGTLQAPIILGMLSTTLASGQIITRTGRYKLLPQIGAAQMAIGLVLFSRMDAHSSRAVISGSMFFFGMGVGLSIQVMILVIQNAVPYRQLGVATSAASLFRSLGSVAGSAGFSAFVNNRFSAHLALRNGGTVSAEILNSPGTIRTLPAATHRAVLASFQTTLHELFLYAVVVAVLSFIVLLFLRELPLRDTIDTDEGDDADDASAANVSASTIDQATTSIGVPSGR